LPESLLKTSFIINFFVTRYHYLCSERKGFPPPPHPTRRHSSRKYSDRERKDKREGGEKGREGGGVNEKKEEVQRKGEGCKTGGWKGK
jgi:hypothetical protein